MKKLLLGLLCIASILALPGCCHRCDDPCDYSCDDYYDDCYNDCDDRSCPVHGDDCYHDHDGKEVIGYEEQIGVRKPIYGKGKATRAARKEPTTCPAEMVSAPKKLTHHKPIHPGAIEGAENIRYLDNRFAAQNDAMERAASAKAASKDKLARNGKMAMPTKEM